MTEIHTQFTLYFQPNPQSKAAGRRFSHILIVGHFIVKAVTLLWSATTRTPLTGEVNTIPLITVAPVERWDVLGKKCAHQFLMLKGWRQHKRAGVRIRARSGPVKSGPRKDSRWQAHENYGSLILGSVSLWCTGLKRISCWCLVDIWEFLHHRSCFTANNIRQEKWILIIFTS